MSADSDFRFSPRANRAAEIQWRPWGEPAFAEARRLGRPVLLSISAVWCHWCHVMDETSYSDERAIALVNERFLPVRVDNDRHPDVNRRYNMGGWPSTVFLTPSGDIITGATYLPPGQFRQALQRVREFFDANRATLIDIATPSLEPETTGVTDPDEATIGHVPEEIAAGAVRSFDPLHGGIGTEPKFPQAEVFSFLLAFEDLRPQAPDSPRVTEALATTLRAMAKSAMYDQVGGGFFRYATQRDWSEPHYEKMLEDNARLALLYADALGLARAGVAGDGEPEIYRSALTGIIDYLLGALWLPDLPAFAGSQDADEHYYKLDAVARKLLPAPFIDETVYVDWNALAARALLRAARALERPELADRAAEVLAYLMGHARRGDGMAHFLTPDGRPSDRTPLLADQASVAAALLDAYETSGERSRLDDAVALADWALDRFAAADGRLNDRPADADGAGLLARPLPVLDDNALVADVMLRLAEHTGDETWRERALELLGAWTPHYQRHGVGAAPYALAVLRAEERPERVVVVGGCDDPGARRLHGAALAASRRLATVQLLDPGRDGDASHIAAAGYDAAAAPVAYVCRGRSCRPPIGDPGELSALLSAG